ncbi:hypothetical protein B5X24_HaOG212419 [Helicoverpa armigera]|uniref:Uncharacterized protein n=1 Tax=Helicoverpa armigera TaxID=29058 RepID=A0A2W1B795_HELAM|nr:hypothetical protein B5X24_HaOG212419 [Helicoverpa armigera]
MSPGQRTLQISFAVIIIIFYRNSFHWLRLCTNIDRRHMPWLTAFPTSSSIDPDWIMSSGIQMIQDADIRYSVWYTTTDERGGGDQAAEESKPAEQAPEPEQPAPEEPVQQQQPEPPPVEETPQSRIPTFDEYDRFRDSSRPPDSHYRAVSGPFHGRKRSCCGTSDLSYLVMVWSLVLVFVL